MTREETTVCDRGDVPRGYVVTYHELRGYDSPDRWYSARTTRGRVLGNNFGSYAEAVDACRADVKMRVNALRVAKQTTREIEQRAAELAARVLCGASPINAMGAAEFGGWVFPDAGLYNRDHEAGRLARCIVGSVHRRNRT